jgi:hypothetical protein
MRLLTALHIDPPALKSKLLASGWIAGFLLLLSGCNVVIKNPPDQATVLIPAVAVNVDLPPFYRAGTFGAQLNDADITSQFTVDAQNRTADANLTLIPGQYILDVTACWIININFFLQPPWPTQGCSSARAQFNRVQPSLVLAPSGLTVPVSQINSATVQAIPAPTSNLIVTLSSTPVGKLSAPAYVTVPANSATAINIQLQGMAPGSANLNASANGYIGATLNSIAVPPLVTQLSPTSGPVGTAVTATGAGFIAPVTAHFGTTSAPVTLTSATQLSAPVPNGLAAGATQFTVTSGGQTSSSVTFTVNASAASNDIALFRATNDRIEILQFTPKTPFSSSTFQLLGSVPTSTSPGMISVGLCRDGARLAWTGASDVKLFSIGGTMTAPTLTQVAATPLPTNLSGTGTACAFLSTTPAALVRGTDNGVESLDPTTTPLAKFGGFNGALAPLGVSMIAASPRVWRSYPDGLEEYSLSSMGVPSRVANFTTNITASTTGTSVAWLSFGATLVRASNVGIDILDVTGSPSRVSFLNTGGASSAGVGVSIVGTRVVRATDMGIEIYDASIPSTPVRCAFRNTGGSSATGVGVFAVGSVAFRATNVGIEAYDISNTSCPSPASGTIIPAPVQLQAGLGTSTTGVALVGR